MSAKGQKRTFKGLFDHFTGLCEQRGRKRYTERLGGPEIDHQLVLRWRLHWEICRLLALEYTINIAGSQPKRVHSIRAITDQTAIQSVRIDRGQFVLRGKFDDQVVMR